MIKQYKLYMTSFFQYIKVYKVRYWVHAIHCLKFSQSVSKTKLVLFHGNIITFTSDGQNLRTSCSVNHSRLHHPFFSVFSFCTCVLIQYKCQFPLFILKRYWIIIVLGNMDNLRSLVTI